MKRGLYILRLVLCLSLCLTQLFEISALAVSSVQTAQSVSIQDIETITEDGKAERKLTEEEKTAIRAMIDAEAILASNEMFSPEKAISVLESIFAQWVLAGRPVPNGKNPFLVSVKKEDEKYLPALFWAYNNKLLIYGEDVKKVNSRLQLADLSRNQSRIDMIEDLYREWCIDFPEVKASEKPAADVALNGGGKSHVYADALAWALAEGIIKENELKKKADGLYFEPEKAVTRVQASLWLYRFHACMEAEKAKQ